MLKKNDKNISRRIASNRIEPTIESLQLTSKMISNYLNQSRNNNTNSKKYYFSINQENSLSKFNKMDKYFNDILAQVFDATSNNSYPNSNTQKSNA